MKHPQRRHWTKPASRPSLLERINPNAAASIAGPKRTTSPSPPTVTRPRCARSRPSRRSSIGPYSALRLLAEIGTDMSRWPTEKHFTSGLTLAPHNKISGGRLLSSRTSPSANRAAAILRIAAMSLGRTETALGAFYRRLAYRVCCAT